MAYQENDFDSFVKRQKAPRGPVLPPPSATFNVNPMADTVPGGDSASPVPNDFDAFVRRQQPQPKVKGTIDPNQREMHTLPSADNYQLAPPVPLKPNPKPVTQVRGPVAPPAPAPSFNVNPLAGLVPDETVRPIPAGSLSLKQVRRPAIGGAVGQLLREGPVDVRAMTPDEKAKAMSLPVQTPQAGTLRQAGNQFAQSALKQAAQTPYGVARFAENLGSMMSPSGAATLGQEGFLSSVLKRPTEEAVANIETRFPTAQDNSWLTGKIPQALGSVAGFAGLGAMGKAAGIGQSAMAGIGGVGAEVAQFLEEAKQSGIDPRRVQNGIAMAGVTGITEMLGLGKILDKFGVKKPVFEKALDYLEEGGQEALQGYMEDLNAKLIAVNDPNRNINPTSTEFWLKRGEEFALGMIGTAPIAGADIAIDRINRQMEESAIRKETAKPFTLTPPATPKSTQVVPLGAPRSPQAQNTVNQQQWEQERYSGLPDADKAQVEFQRAIKQAQTITDPLQRSQAIANIRAQYGEEEQAPPAIRLDESGKLVSIPSDKRQISHASELLGTERGTPIQNRLTQTGINRPAPNLSDIRAENLDFVPPAKPLLGSVVNPEGGIPAAPEVKASPGAMFDRMPFNETQEDIPDVLKTIRKYGGVKDDGIHTGEIRNILGNKETGTTGLVNRNGLTPDRMREALVEDGILPPDSTVADFFDLINNSQSRRTGQAQTPQTIDDYYSNLPETPAFGAQRGPKARTGIPTPVNRPAPVAASAAPPQAPVSLHPYKQLERLTLEKHPDLFETYKPEYRKTIQAIADDMGVESRHVEALIEDAQGESLRHARRQDAIEKAGKARFEKEQAEADEEIRLTHEIAKIDHMFEDPDAVTPPPAVSEETKPIAGEKVSQPSTINDYSPKFRMWRAQGRLIRHAQPGQKISPEQARDVIESLRQHKLTGVYDGDKGVVRVSPRAGLLAEMERDIQRAWDQYGSQSVQKIKETRAQQKVAERKTEAQKQYQEVLGAKATASKWIDDVFGAGAMNDFNKSNLAAFLDGASQRFEGLPNPKWQTGLEKIGALKDGRVDFDAIKQAYQSQTAKATEKPPIAEAIRSAVPENSDTASVKDLRQKGYSDDEIIQAVKDSNYEFRLSRDNRSEAAIKASGGKDLSGEPLLVMDGEYYVPSITVVKDSSPEAAKALAPETASVPGGEITKTEQKILDLLDPVKSPKGAPFQWLSSRVGKDFDSALKSLIDSGKVREVAGQYYRADAPATKVETKSNARKEIKALTAEQEKEYNHGRSAGLSHDEAMERAKGISPNKSAAVPMPDWETNIFRARQYAKDLMDSEAVPDTVRADWAEKWTNLESLVTAIKSFVDKPTAENAAAEKAAERTKKAEESPKEKESPNVELGTRENQLPDEQRAGSVSENDRAGVESGRGEGEQRSKRGTRKSTTARRPDVGSERTSDADSNESVSGGAVSVGQGGRGEQSDSSIAEHGGPDTSRTESQEPSAARQPGDYVITDIDAVTPSGKVGKLRANLAAIRLVKTILSEGRGATAEEQSVLAQYTGWGQFPELFNEYNESGNKLESEREELKELVGEKEYEEARASIKNAHYTSPRMIAAMWRMMERMGIRQGRILEPSMGIGSFFGLMPKTLRGASARVGIELDILTGQMAKLLYPQSNIQIKGFEKHKVPDNFYDLVIGNVPFGDYRVHDPEYNKYRANIHDYFILKSIDKTRPGGLVAVITSTGTLDKSSDKIRKAIASKANLVAAMRLPESTFEKNAGTAVVTDLLIFQKRGDGIAEDQSWVDLGTLPDPDGGADISISKYYVQNPQMILGTLDRKSRMYGAGDSHVSRTDDFEERLSNAIDSLPEGIVIDAKTAITKAPERVVNENERLAEGSLTIKSGKVYRRSGDHLVEEKMDEADVKKLTRLLNVRDALQSVINDQIEGKDAADSRSRLNKEYDYFVSVFGPLRKRGNASLLAEDPSSYLILALESDYNTKTGKAKKAPIFTRDIISRGRQTANATTPADAVAASLFTSGTIDIPYMVDLLKTTEEDLTKQLASQNLAFENPSTGWESSEKYLSGNVRKKLIDAKAAADLDPRFLRNVAALAEVQPADIDIEDIFVRLGSPWVPSEDVQDFLGHLLDGQPDHFSVQYSANSGQWFLGWSTSPSDQRAQSITKRSSKALEVYGTAKVPVIDIIEAAINDTPVKVWDVDDKGNRTLNLDESEKANGKAQDIKDAFSDWIWTDATRAERLHRYYNDNFNNIRPIEYKGDHYKNENGEFVLPGMNPLVQLRPNQMKDVWQAVSNGKLLDASEVGAGKTFIMGAIAMEWRRLGMAKKPAIVVPKSRLDPTVAELQLLYPGAKILNFGKSFEGDKRQQATANAATGDYDVIVMSHEQLDFMPMRPDVVESYIRDEIQEIEDRLDELREADPEGYREAMRGKRGGNRVVKQLEKAKERAEARLEEALDSSRRDKAVYFEESGIDAILVDEAHAFKSLPVYSRRAELKGVPTSRSNRATSMLMRTRWLLSQNRGRGVVFATGTPVSNTLAELYNMQRYLQSDELKERGIQTFDAWADVFTNATTNYEYKATGDYQAVTRLTDFVNLPELRALTQQVMATNFVDEMPWVTRPTKKEFVHSLPMSEDQRQYLQEIRERADRLRKMSPAERKASGDNFLVLSTDARKSSLSTRLVNSSAAEDDGKISSAVNNILRIFHERPGKTQMIFCDMGVNKTNWGYSVYDEVIDRLVKGGVPKERIINFATATDKRRQEAADKLRKGEYLIAIGSTWKMGTGVNAQDLITAMHHLDIAWVPAYLEQRNGRGHRQGNTNSEVESHYYVTEGSFDLVMWQAVTRKLRGINSFMRGGMERTMRMDDTGDESSGELSPEMIMAAASGNPYELDRVKAQQDLERLERAERSYRGQLSQYKSRLANSSQVLKKYEEQKRDAEQGFAQYEATKGQDFKVNIDGKEYDNRKAAGEALAKYLQSRKHLLSEPVKIGSYRGFSVWADTVTDHITGEIRSRLMLSMPGMSYGVHVPGNERALNTASNYVTQMHVYADDFANFSRMMPDASVADIWQKIGQQRNALGLLTGPPNFGAVFTSIDEGLKTFDRMAQETTDAIKRTKLDIETAKDFIDNPFKRAKELEEAKQKVKVLRDKISEFEESRKQQAAKSEEEPTVVEIPRRGEIRASDEGAYDLKTGKSRFSDRNEMLLSVEAGKPKRQIINPWRTPRAEKPTDIQGQAEIGSNIRAQFRRRKGGRQGVAWVNEQATIAISSAMQRAGVPMPDGPQFEGLSTPLENAQIAVDGLRERAEFYRGMTLLKDAEREASSKEFENLVDQLEEAMIDAQANGAIAIAIVDATAPYAARIAREELFHNWQRKASAMSSGDEIIRRMPKAMQDVYRDKIKPVLAKEGYKEFADDDIARSNSREYVLVTEAAAKMASGQAAHYNVNDAEAKDFLKNYFQTVARMFGRESLERMDGINYAAKQVLQDVEEGTGSDSSAISERRSGGVRPSTEGTGRTARADGQLAAIGKRLSSGAEVGRQSGSGKADGGGVRQGEKGERGGGVAPPKAPRAKKEKPAPVPANVKRDVGASDYLRSPLSNLNFVGTYERLAGDVGKQISELFRESQEDIAKGRKTKQDAMKDLRKGVKPLIDQLRAGKATRLALMVKKHMAELEDPDEALAKISQSFTTFQYVTKLKFNPRSTLMNMLQPVQTLWPHFSTKEFGRLVREAYKPENRKRLGEIAAKESGGKVESMDDVERPRKWYNPATYPDMFAWASVNNRVMGHLAGEMAADRLGLTGIEKERMAADWAQKVEFDNSRYNVPPLFRNNIAKVLGQFKPFQIKNIERIIADFKAGPKGATSGNLARRSKIVFSQVLIGGLRSIPLFKSIGGILLLGALAKLFSAAGIDDDDANKWAEVTYFGAPALISQDFSGSVNIIDVPFGNTTAEKAVNLFGGPTASTIVTALDNANKAWNAQTKKETGKERLSREEKTIKAVVGIAKAITPYTKTAQAAIAAGQAGYEWSQGDPVSSGTPVMNLRGAKVEMTKTEAVGHALMGTPKRQTLHYDIEDAYDWQKKGLKKIGVNIASVEKTEPPPFRRPGEPDDLYKARMDKASEWKKTYGDKLESFPGYQSLSDDEKQRADKSLHRRILDRTNQSSPDMRGLEPGVILKDLQKSAKAQARKNSKMIYVPETQQ